MSDAAVRRLQAYAWPGNVRELANVIERGTIVSTGGTFDIDRALPEAPAADPGAEPATNGDASPERILWATELFENARARNSQAEALVG